jgi:hypothetical protein
MHSSGRVSPQSRVFQTTVSCFFLQIRHTIDVASRRVCFVGLKGDNPGRKELYVGIDDQNLIRCTRRPAVESLLDRREYSRIDRWDKALLITAESQAPL